MDCTYHCKYASRIPMLEMDPSVAVVNKFGCIRMLVIKPFFNGSIKCYILQCFLCLTRRDFDELCETIENKLMQESQPLFEMCENRPAHWGPSDFDENSTIFGIKKKFIKFIIISQN